jgi:hypothetical protein
MGEGVIGTGKVSDGAGEYVAVGRGDEVCEGVRVCRGAAIEQEAMMERPRRGRVKANPRKER